MKPIIKEMKDITDSKEMYESKPHPFIGIFIYIILAFLILGSTWAYFGEVDIVSKGKGVVRPNAQLSSIRNKVAGEVKTSNLKEGQVVHKGDLLFAINHEDLDISYKQAETNLKELKKQAASLEKLKQSIEQGKNLFSKENEKEDYATYLKYEQDYKELVSSNSIESKNEQLSINQAKINQSIYNDKIASCEKEYQSLQEYKNSINLGSSAFSDPSCANALEFKNYQYQVEELKADVETKKKAYALNKSLNEEDLVASQELTDSKVAYELAKSKITALKNEKLEAIEASLEALQKEITGYKQENSKLVVDNDLINEKDSQRKLALEAYKTEYLVNLYNKIEENKTAYKAQEAELHTALLNIQSCEVKAPIDGTIHMINEITPGDLLASGDNVATIIPTEGDLYTIEIFVPNSEIAGLKVGNAIKYKFDALPYKEYGELEGKITSISTDAQYNEAYGISGYIIEANVANQTVYSYKGEAAEIKVGMTCEAHIITDHKKILYNLLEKINLKE